jgi:hypothetical protein
MSGYESILQELADAYGVEVSTVPHDRVEWGINRLRRLVAPLQTIEVMRNFFVQPIRSKPARGPASGDAESPALQPTNS